jgi:peptidyl-prolyl cis-trans isomerase A (cyclophilin A)
MTTNASVALAVAATAAMLFWLAAAGPAAEPAANPVVVIETSMGDITVELYPDKAPKSVENFLEYVKSGYFKGTIFHRVIKGFMIQGGGFTLDMQRKQTHAPIPLEAQNGLSNKRGTIAMARTADPNSATSQFFINTVDNSRGLDYPSNGGYAVFGKVTAGMDVVDKIESVPTGAKPPFAKDVPLKPVVIKDVRLKP